MKKFKRDESGQVLAIIALALVAILGFAALAVDVGFMMHKKAQLQKAADAAALAGIMDAWKGTSTHVVAEATAKQYGESNGASETDAKVKLEHPGYEPSANLIGAPIFLDVTCYGTVNHFFAPLLGIKSTDIEAKATAVKVVEWKGEALPFINLEQNPTGLIGDSGDSIVLWNKTTKPGQKEAIDFGDYAYSGDPFPHFNINYLDGVDVATGKKMKYSNELNQMWIDHQSNQRTVYVLSLKPSLFPDGEVRIVEKVGGKLVVVKKVKLPELKDLKNKDTISPDDLVLLECIWTDFVFDNGNNMLVKAQVKGIHSITDVPDSYDGIGKMLSYLIK